VFAGSCETLAMTTKGERRVEDRITCAIMTRDDPALTSSNFTVARGQKHDCRSVTIDNTCQAIHEAGMWCVSGGFYVEV
jgi:hypothetical protein